MGRTKGSLNKKTITDRNVGRNIKKLKNPIIIKKTIPVKKISNKNWLLTKTIRGTPIAITGFSKSPQHCDLIVIPNYESRSYVTTVDSRSVIKPKFTSIEIEKEFNGIVFASEE